MRIHLVIDVIDVIAKIGSYGRETKISLTQHFHKFILLNDGQVQP